MEKKEYQHRHSIPKDVVNKTLAKHEVVVKYEYHSPGRGSGTHRAKAMLHYKIVDKKGKEHGIIGIGVRSKKIDYWSIF